MIKKTIWKNLLVIAGCSVALAAQADLTVVNNTNEPSTSVISGICSSILGDKGVTQPGQTNVVEDKTINIICRTETCSAKIYMTKNCGLFGAKPVATANYNKATGQIDVQNLSDRYLLVSPRPYTMIVSYK